MAVLAQVALQGSKPFCMGMGELCGCKNEPPTTLEPPKRKLKLQKQQPRFKHMSDDDMTTICKGYVPPNTAKTQNGALLPFESGCLLAIRRVLLTSFQTISRVLRGF